MLVTELVMFQPDDSDQLLGVTTRYREWCVAASKLAGQGGAFRSNDVEIECVGSSVCGQFAAWFVLHGFPARVDGSIREPWKDIVHVMRNSGCRIGDAFVRSKVRFV